MHSITSVDIWFSRGLCPVRLIGDICLVVSTPMLIYRLRKNGATGVSVETQILRLVMIVTRYLDLFAYGRVVSGYNTYMKIILAVTSLYTVGALVFEYKAYSFADLKAGKYRLGLPLLFATCLASVFTYRYTFVELAWAFSQFLGIVAYIPQLSLLVNPENRDWKMNTYACLLAGYRAFYIPHWILRYLRWGALDPIAAGAGVCEAVIFVIAFVVIVRNTYKHRHARLQSPEDGISKDTTAMPITAVSDIHGPYGISDSKSVINVPM